MNTEILDESPLYREWVDGAKAEGKAVGIAEGKAVGLAQALKLALEGRFGVLSADLVAAIDSVDEAQLVLALPHVGTDSLELARARFGLASP